MKRRRLLSAAVCAVFLCSLLLSVLTLRALLEKRVRTELAALSASAPERALETADVLLNAEETAEDPAVALGLTREYYALVARRIVSPGAAALLCALALLPPLFAGGAVFFCVRREKSEAEKLEERVALARRDGWAFSPGKEEERLLSDVFSDCRRLSEVGARREAELKIYVENVAHQIKTPLAGLTLQLDLLSEEVGEKEALTLAQEEASRIGDYIGKLLTLARLRAGRVRFQQTEVDLDGLLGELLSLPLCAGTSFTRRGASPAVVTGDPEWLRQALMNLLQNAVTHGGNADVLLDVSGTQIRLRIENDAPDAPLPEDPFQRYRVQNENGTSTGVGLSIAKEAITAFGGRISLRATDGEKVLTEVFLPVFRFSPKL